MGHHQAGQGDEDEADGGHQARIGSAQHQGGQGADEQLRRGDPDQGLAHLQRPEAAHGAQVLGDEIGGGQDGQPQEGHQQQQARQGRAQRDLEVEERVAGSPFMDEEGGHQQDAGEQQAPDQAGIQPVQAIALVEPGIDQGQADPAGGQAEGVDPGDVGIGRIAGHAEPQEGEHADGQRHVLPEDPAPGEVVHIPALQRGGDVERELQVQRVERDAIGPGARRRGAQDEAEGERDEEA